MQVQVGLSRPELPVPFPIVLNCPEEAHTYAAVTAALSSWIYSPHSCALPAGLQLCNQIRLMEEEATVQWAVVSADDTLFVVFKGTSNVLDMMIDLGCLPLYVDSIELRVHGGIWCALHSTKHSVVDEIILLLQTQPVDKRVVLCGHSLGGGMALVSALELLCRGCKVDAVIAHGSPQVVVPDYTNCWWLALNGLATVYVNQWDLVPRLPSCKNWLLGVATDPHLVGVRKGPFFVRVNVQQKVTAAIEKHWGVLSQCRHIGSVMFISAWCSGAMRVESCDPLLDDPGAVCHEALWQAPPNVDEFVILQHQEYPVVTEQLIRSCIDIKKTDLSCNPPPLYIP